MQIVVTKTKKRQRAASDEGEFKMWYLSMLILFMSLSSQSSAGLTCGSSSDVTNINSAITPDATALTSTFRQLDTSCFSKTKSTLLSMQATVKEGNKCDLQASRLLTKLEQMCAYLKPLGGFAAKFDRVLKILKFLHKNLDKITKFADNIPKIGQLRKVIVEKVIPMTLDIMEKLRDDVRKVIDYQRILLKYEKAAKMLWKIDKHGSKVCKLSSPLSLSLQLLRKTIKEVNKPSTIVLQTTSQAQVCMTQYCLGRGGGSSCGECKQADSSFANADSTLSSWKQKMTQCHEKLSNVNALMSKLNVISSLRAFAEEILNKIERFLSPINDKLSKFANSVSKVASNLMSCCPCGRPNLVGCALEATTKIINLISCPLDGLTNYLITNFMASIKSSMSKLVRINIPKISVGIEFPVGKFSIPLPSFLQSCLRQTTYGKGFTIFCGLSTKSIQLSISSSFKPKKSSLAGTSSLSSQIRSSCSSALNALVKFGKNMRNCFDRADDLFFAIPVVGFFAAMTCDPNYKDPDPGINYCPCQSKDDSFVNDNGDQPNCVVWHKSWYKGCTRTCQDKKYSAGKDPSGKTRLMYKTYGYPHCDKLKYYCRKGNVNVKNGRVSCKNAYTYLGGSCEIIAKPGYICPISKIHCGATSRAKAVCWDYRFIECAKNDGKSFPMCTCRNRDNGGFARGELVCQAGGSSSSDNLASLKQVRKSTSCFRPLGKYTNIKADCGSYMHPCVVQKPAVDAYERCSMSRAEKFWDAHGKKFVIAGAVFLVIGVLATIGSFVAGAIPAAVGTIILTIIGIILLSCGLAIKTPGDEASNYIRMGAGY